MSHWTFQILPSIVTLDANMIRIRVIAEGRLVLINVVDLFDFVSPGEDDGEANRSYLVGRSHPVKYWHLIIHLMSCLSTWQQRYYSIFGVSM